MVLSYFEGFWVFGVQNSFGILARAKKSTPFGKAIDTFANWNFQEMPVEGGVPKTATAALDGNDGNWSRRSKSINKNLGSNV